MEFNNPSAVYTSPSAPPAHIPVELHLIEDAIHQYEVFFM